MPAIEAHITGTVWKIECQVGDRVQEGDTVVILESMKMEMPVEAEDSGTVTEIRWLTSAGTSRAHARPARGARGGDRRRCPGRRRSGLPPRRPDRAASRPQRAAP